jgi:polysaccharide pyruvyl transferase WcaK-like protein
MRKIYFEGYYGRGNFGDDVFTLLGERLAVTRWGCQRAYFSAPSSPNFKVRGIARAAFPARRLFRGHSRALAFARAIRSRNVMLFGGSTLHSVHGPYREYDLAARAGALRLYAAGVSVGPFATRTDARNVARFLDCFRFVSVRDTVSLERLQDSGSAVPVVHGADLALLLPELLFPAALEKCSREQDPIVAVSVCRSDPRVARLTPQDVMRVEGMASALRPLQRDGALVRIVVLNNDPNSGDLEISQRLVALLDERRVELCLYDGEVGRIVELFASADVVMSTRLHGAVIAYTYGIPLYAVSYHEKCDDFCSEIGIDEAQVAGPSGPDVATAEVLRAMLEHPNRYRATVTVEESRRRAWAALPQALA